MSGKLIFGLTKINTDHSQHQPGFTYKSSFKTYHAIETPILNVTRRSYDWIMKFLDIRFPVVALDLIVNQYDYLFVHNLSLEACWKN